MKEVYNLEREFKMAFKFLAAGVFLFFATFSCQSAITPIEREKLFRDSNLKTDYVMVGDSITLQGDWQSLLSIPNVANRGIGGNTSKAILNRMDGILKVNPKKAFLLFGVNDFSLKEPVDTVFSNYQKIIISLQSHCIEPIIFTTPQCSETKLKRCIELNKGIKQLNALLKTYAGSQGLKLFDLDASLSDTQGLKMIYSSDGMHLNLRGFKIWSAFISKEIK